MKKTVKLEYFIIMLSSFLCLNYFFTNIITYKLSQGWHFSSSLFDIIYVENTGAAFSIMQNSTKFLIVLSILALAVIFYCIKKNIENIFIKEIIFLSFLISGILGNLFERIFLGHVRDFFSLNFINFPIFNISDLFINIGVLGIIILILSTNKPIKIL